MLVTVLSSVAVVVSVTLAELALPLAAGAALDTLWVPWAPGDIIDGVWDSPLALLPAVADGAAGAADSVGPLVPLVVVHEVLIVTVWFC